MLVKYTKTETIYFEKENYPSIEDEVLKRMNKRYQSDKFTLESITLYNYKDYGIDNDSYFSGKVVVEISQILPYGQEPSESDFFVQFDIRWNLKVPKNARNKINKSPTSGMDSSSIP